MIWYKGIIQYKAEIMQNRMHASSTPHNAETWAKIQTDVNLIKRLVVWVQLTVMFEVEV